MIEVEDTPEYEVWTGAYAEPMFGVVTQGTIRIHPLEKCAGSACPFHNPSNHPLNQSEIVVRMDKRFIVERTCPHGIGHSDPDSIAYVESVAVTPGERDAVQYLARHGCDGCCTQQPGK